MVKGGAREWAAKDGLGILEVEVGKGLKGLCCCPLEKAEGSTVYGGDRPKMLPLTELASWRDREKNRLRKPDFARNGNPAYCTPTRGRKNCPTPSTGPTEETRIVEVSLVLLVG